MDPVLDPAAGWRSALGPRAFPLTQDDNLQVQSFCSTSGVVLTIAGRVKRSDGTIEWFTDTHTPNSNGSAKTTFHYLAEGALLDLTIYASTGSPTGTQCPIVARLVRGDATTPKIVALVCQGYVTTTQDASFPLSSWATSVSVTTAQPTILSVQQAAPAAGAEQTYTVPAGKVYRLMSFAVALVTSATVASRRVQLIIDDGTNVLFKADPNQGQAASLTYTYTGGDGTQQTALDPTTLAWQVPANVRLAAGWRLRTLTANIQTDDQWGALNAGVESL